MRFRDAKKLLPFLGALVVGIGAITYGGHRMRAQAREAWLNQAYQDAVRVTDTGLFLLSMIHAQLRGVGTLFYSSSEVLEDELFDALEVMEAIESAIPITSLAYVVPSDDGRLRVTLSTDADGLLAPGSDLSAHEGARIAVTKAMEVIDAVVSGTAYEATPGRLHALLAFAAPNGGVDGAIVTPVDITALIEGLYALHIPKGMRVRLVEKFEPTAGTEVSRAVVGGKTPNPGTVQTFRIITDSGQAYWEVYWDVLPAYSGGPATQLADVVQVSGTVVFLLVLSVVGLLSRQNTRVGRLVEERTAELQEATERAEAANRAKSVFLANISHEIRTPMNAILGFAEILNRSASDPQQKEYLSSIETSGRSLLALINDILDLSRSESGGLELKSAPTDTLKMFGDVEAGYSAKAKEKGLGFEMEVDPNMPRSISVDEKRVSQVLGNLVDNAVKFTHKGHVRIAVRSVTSGNGNRFVDLSFEVEDSGTGIPNDQLDEIFNAFTQKSGQSINEYGGTGLGLAITHSLVEIMQGNVTVSSEEGVGSTFQVSLPGIEVVDSTRLGDLEAEMEIIAEGAQAEAWSPGQMSSAAREKLPELVSVLKGQQTTSEQLAETLTINEVEAFADLMKATGGRHEYQPLLEWSQKLARQSAAFDMDGLSESLKEFRSIIQEADSLART